MHWLFNSSAVIPQGSSLPPKRWKYRLEITFIKCIQINIMARQGRNLTRGTHIWCIYIVTSEGNLYALHGPVFQALDIVWLSGAFYHTASPAKLGCSSQDALAELRCSRTEGAFRRLGVSLNCDIDSSEACGLIRVVETASANYTSELFSQACSWGWCIKQKETWLRDLWKQ